MTTTEEQLQATGEVYSFTGTLIEACSCNVLCPSGSERIRISATAEVSSRSTWIPVASAGWTCRT
jgi:hypothetical protein